MKHVCSVLFSYTKYNQENFINFQKAFSTDSAHQQTFHTRYTF